MDQSERDQIIKRYSDRLTQFGHDPRSLGWTKNKHELRYHILLSHWKLAPDAKILDFGCGFGDMFGFAKRKGYSFLYEGFDLNPELIKTGRQAYPDAVLRSGDPFHEGLPGRYDYIFSSGVHNLKLNDTWSFIERSFDLFDKHSSSGFAVNFLSNRVEYELEETYHSDPVRVLDLAYRYSNRIVLRNDYMPFEFTVFVDKRTDFDKQFAVYPEFLGFVKDE